MTLIRKPRDFWFGALFLVGSIVLLVISTSYEFGTARQMGPGYFPVVLCICLAALSVALIGRSFFGSHEPREDLAIRPLAIVLLSCMAFGLLIRPAGLVPASLTVVALGSLAGSEYRWLHSAILAIVLTAASVLLFVFGLGQAIPVLGYWFG